MVVHVDMKRQKKNHPDKKMKMNSHRKLLFRKEGDRLANLRANAGSSTILDPLVYEKAFLSLARNPSKPLFKPEGNLRKGGET